MIANIIVLILIDFDNNNLIVLYNRLLRWIVLKPKTYNKKLYWYSAKILILGQKKCYMPTYFIFNIYYSHVIVLNNIKHVLIIIFI